MAIAFNAGSSTNTAGINASTRTFAHTCAGTNPILIVMVSWQGTTTLNSVTYNGVAMTAHDTVLANSNSRVRYYYMLNPPTGSAYNVVVTLSGNTAFGAVAASFSGVAQTAPELVVNASATNTTPTGSITPLTAGAFVLGGFSMNINNSVNATNGTLIAGGSNSGGPHRYGLAYSGPVSPVASRTISFNTSASATWAEKLISLAPATDATPTSLFFQMF